MLELCMLARYLGVNTKQQQIYLASEDGHNKHCYILRKINKDNNTAIYTHVREADSSRETL